MVVRKSALFIALVAASGASFAGGRSDLVLEALAAGHAEYNPGQLLVQYGSNASKGARSGVARGLGARVEEEVRPAGNGKGALELLSLPPGLAIADAVRSLDGVNEVEFAEPNWAYFHQATSNDSYYTNGSLWGMYGDATTPANQFGSQAGEATSNDCSGVYVGIIDEGYMYSHEDLAANAGTVPGEIAGNGIDDNGNGLVDDVYGWDFDGNDSSVFDGLADDHGTHVAGTIAGVGNNGKGVVGVCHSGVKLLSAKFLGARGGSTANAVKAVDYFTDLKNRGVKVVATNNSWGGGGYSQALADAIERANAANILFVAAAGNSAYNCESADCYPSEYANANVIGVASITNTGALSSFSSYGSSVIDIGAPGSGIWSTVPVQIRKNQPVTSGYASYNGTSMATPHVTGAAALYAAHNPSASAATIKAAILGSAVPTPSLNGKVLSNGRLNASGF